MRFGIWLALSGERWPNFKEILGGYPARKQPKGANLAPVVVRMPDGTVEHRRPVDHRKLLDDLRHIRLCGGAPGARQAAVAGRPGELTAMVECFRCGELVPPTTPESHHRYMTMASAGNQYWVDIFCKCGPKAGIPLVDVANFRDEISPMTAPIQ